MESLTTGVIVTLALTIERAQMMFISRGLLAKACVLRLLNARAYFNGLIFTH
ncbi:hypothetical protein [Nostoc sp. LPT]|uniref:hypothetical protein n=1 Tax=Nostoc sp. LPT TaxID=2815387 RepID=UPI001D824DBB|nr:hypothetical protein [Nostoc sp. LPT]MBN4002925.1 hypothetical protein [Nostoc sp. LPT]